MAQILVADGEELIRRFLKECLELEGHQVIVVEDGNEALKRHWQNPADLILIDPAMPEKKGIETIIEMRQSYPKVKIIVLSGSSLVNMEMARLLGADASLKKPFDIDALMKIINLLLRN